jgi:polysaccharide pyruvyl transferase WcaK-like protein
MTPASPLPKLAGAAARDFTRAIYSGLLEREPDEGGADAYREFFEHGGQLVDAIKCVAASTEFRERFMRQFAGDSMRAVFQGLLRRDPTCEELAGGSSSADLAKQLRTIATSEELWTAQLERNAARLAHELAERLLADMRGAVIDPVLRSRGAVDRMARWISAVTQTDEYGAALFRRRAVSVVNEIYLALLNRDADPAGLAQYVPDLAAPSDVGSVVKKIADSEEHWQRQLHRHRAELAGLIYQCVLERPPTPEDLANCESRSVGALVEALVQSDELWHLLLRRRAPELVTRVASALDLGRAEDDAAWAGVIEGIRSVTESDRYFVRLANRRGAAMTNDPPRAGNLTPAAVAIGHVEELFRKLAGRAPSPLEVSRCLAHGAQVGRATPAVLRDSAIRREPRERKVLLFGAYGNGNMGDAYQAIALQKHLTRSWGLQERQIFATSLIDSYDFPFPAAQKLPPDTILNTRLINEFDRLIIGGGGLIAHPHAPLFDSKWVKQVHTPVLLLGIGAELLTVEPHRELLERAWLVSGRDATSIAALKVVRADAVLIRDPVLSAFGIEDLSTSDAQPRSAALPETETDVEVLWVLKYPDSEEDADFLIKVANLIQEQTRVRHAIVGIEPGRDQVLEQFLPGKVQYLRSLSDLIPRLEQAGVVVSMRYHGCIFAALAGKPSVGYSQSKIKHLYADRLIPGFYEPAFGHLTDILCAPRRIKSRLGRLETMRREFCAQLKSVGNLALMADCPVTSPQPKGRLRRFLTSI